MTYFRDVWGDEIQALEVELAVSEDNYGELMSKAMMRPFDTYFRGILEESNVNREDSKDN